MQRFLIVIFLLWPGIALRAQERMAISQWLTSGVVETHYPVFHETNNTAGKPFSNEELLSFNPVDLMELYPQPGAAFHWAGSQPATWVAAYSDENGYLHIGNTVTPPGPQLAYMAVYIKAERWIESQLEIKSPYLLEAWLNGKKIGTKASMETDENTVGKVTQKLKLPRGTHLLMIKTLRPPEEGLEWKVMANMEIKEPYKNEDIAFVLLPLNIKNINHVLDGIKLTGISLSPDGTLYTATYSRSLPPSDQSESWTEVKRLSDNRLIHSFRHARISRVSWLPASNALSYTSSRDSKTSIHWHHMETGEQRVVLQDEENLTGFSWSPDESFIIYTLREESSGADAVMRQVLGMNDRQGQWRNRSFLYKLDIATGVKSRLTYGNLSTSLQDISPDNTSIIFSTSRPDYLERPYSKQDLFMLNLNTLKVDTLLYDQPWSVRVSYSPDGTRLLATGGPSAFGGVGLNVADGKIPNNYDTQAFILDPKTMEAKCITRDFDPSVSSVYWHRPDNLIYLLTVDQDFQRIYQYDPGKEAFKLVEAGAEFITSMDFARNGQALAFLANQSNAPRKAYHMNLKNQRVGVLEDPESETYRNVNTVEVKDWDITTAGGVGIKGRYYLPPDFDPEAKYPVIVYYYGGTTPVGRTFAGRYPYNLWAGNGYIVYVLQPSGAIGFGQEFSAAHVNNWGITVADEIIEATQKFLEAHPYANPEKVGCAGASYGGFMTMLLMTRTDIFAAAISHAGISSIASYWGEGYWGYSYSAEASAESFPWNNKDIYIGQSPLFHADRVNTPLLLLTGDSDTNVPPGESIQMYTALKMLGRPVELVMVKGEDHHIVTYSKRILWHNTIMAWWDKYLKGQPEWWNEQYPENNY